MADSRGESSIYIYTVRFQSMVRELSEREGGGLAGVDYTVGVSKIRDTGGPERVARRRIRGRVAVSPARMGSEGALAPKGHCLSRCKEEAWGEQKEFKREQLPVRRPPP